jgi:ABC-type xylose transport system substrate-binding protein
MTTLNQTWTAADDLKLRQEAEESLRTTNWDVEQATATYYMEKDMSAMAARIDQLLAENDRLQRALTKEST